ncbi:MAG TPA: glucose-6-phosphate isomerase [Alphaproteobacteria bacterium]|nr:glucose-6-phosphate isomerase [Alphaproteobacteria bacterium]
MPDTVTALPYSQDIANCFADKIGKGGLDRPTLDDYVARTASALKRLRAAVANNSLPILTLPKREDEMRAMREAAQRYRGLEHVIVLGTGGSSLGGRTVTALADGGLGSAGRLSGRPLLWFIENVDPWGFDKIVESVDARTAGLVIISKSGGTAETLSQALALLPRLEQAVGRDKLQQRCTVITEPTDNPLRRLAQRYGLPLIDHDPNVGGRYSVLSPTGMLPTLIAGLDAAKVRAGAQEALDAAIDNEPMRSPPAVGAALNIALAATRGAVQTVVMPYIDRLAPFGLWFRQLWAESLGKDGKGTTPIRAQGAVDQHSQLQLYLSGPADKLYTIIMGEARGIGPRYAREQLVDKALDWLAGRTMGDLLDVSQRATAETLARNGRPVRIIRVPTLDERSLGALMMHYMLETIIAADLLGIDPFDQPAVEEGKKLARQYLAEMG